MKPNATSDDSRRILSGMACISAIGLRQIRPQVRWTGLLADFTIPRLLAILSLCASNARLTWARENHWICSSGDWTFSSVSYCILRSSTIILYSTQPHSIHNASLPVDVRRARIEQRRRRVARRSLAGCGAQSFYLATADRPPEAPGISAGGVCQNWAAAV